MTDTKSPPPKQGFQATIPDEDDPGLLSAAQTAAGMVIAMARDGVVPDAVRLRTFPDGRWYSFPIDRGNTPFQISSITIEQYLAGTVARGLCRCDDNVDWEITRMFALARLCPTFGALYNLIEEYMPVVSAIADRLVITKSMEREELAAYLAPILRTK
jgi:hypothetical protein